jgi:predicted acyltransferase
MNQSRLASLDAFRGLTIAGMILVNNPGSWEYVYAPLRHAEWHGWTPADLIFPFFLFIVGVSITYSLSKRIEQGAVSISLYARVLRRASILVALGFFLRLFPFFRFQGLRIPGVLLRIAICYLAAALLFIKAGPKSRLAATIVLLAGYWVVMKLVPVPGYGAGVLEFDGNLCGYIDTKLLGGHLYRPTFDPEGILSTFPAIATTLLGTLTGNWLRWKRAAQITKMVGLFVAGGILTVSGLFLHPIFPINKQLWTSTFVVFTAGAALLLLGLLFTAIDVLGWKKWSFPFYVFGTNAIAVYAGSILMVKLLELVKISVQGEFVPLRIFLYQRLFVPWAGPLNGSLVYPLLLLFIWLGFLYPLYKKQIFVKV